MSVVWLVIMVPCSLLLTGIGIWAWRRKEPMWFWSGSTVKAEELSDVAGYNRANGIMWIAYSLALWACTAIGIRNVKAAGILLVILCPVGAVIMAAAWHGIREKYAAGERSEEHGG